MKLTPWLCALALLSSSLAAASPSSPRPNVVVIVTDDQGYGDLACHGNTMIRTPHLDRLYAQSVRLTDFHVDPTCAPTRAALLTGRYSTRAGVWHTVMGRSLLNRDEVTMADVFHAGGYRTAAIGKWHLGDNFPFRPQDRGFDETLVHGGGGIGQTPDHWGNRYDDPVLLRNGVPTSSSGYCTDVFFDEARRFVTSQRNHPFFLYLAPNAPHAPFVVAEKYRVPYAARGVPEPMASFYGMIENLDENVGRLLADLEESGLAENTLVIWMTDNGTGAGLPGDAEGSRTSAGEGWQGFDAGLRGKKGSEYDGGHRVPCFVRWPAGGLVGGCDVATLAAHFDLLPTLVELCGLTPPRSELDGISLAPVLRGARADLAERTLFVHRQRREIPPKWEHSAVLTERWRLVNGSELYDIEGDRGQNHDIGDAHPDIVRELRARYESWWDSLAPVRASHAAIVVGAPQENPTTLNAMDWHNDDIRQIPWNQPQIVAMPWANGYWWIEVAEAGNYEFTLRHQPWEAKFPLQATAARVVVNDRVAEVALPAAATSVALKLALPAGAAKLQTWLLDAAAGKTRGAFFVEVRRR
ncbi:MAG TPA: arylsulfatase [Opitutus sp.]|nr:arylsulfatase [Opitutus sp.]